MVRLATQVPPLQDCPVPQGVPFARYVASVQTGWPEPQAMVAVAAHRLVEVQEVPAVQAMHAPEGLQTWPAPQGVPAARNVASAQTGTPVPHWVAPEVAQGFDGVHDAACVQGEQAPEGSQTWFVPQLVPGALNGPSVHTGAPVAHWMVALATQTFVEVQAVPWAQGTHAPALQTCPVPQFVPLATGTPSTQTGLPAVQETVPVMQGFDGVQERPGVQATH